MELTNDRITLLPLDQSDWELFKALNQNPKIMEHLYDILSLDEIKNTFKNRTAPITQKSDAWCFSINDKFTGEKLGNIGLKITPPEAGVAEVGFMLKEAAHGKGYATEALNLIKIYAFNSLGIKKLAAICSTTNTGSYKLLEKSGFTREKFLPRNTVINNQDIDDYIYGLEKNTFIKIEGNL
ncbi:GNAT family N-acetyltransferase [Pseudoalteromonas denitrificans]|uniref:Protein N-acetyltransferase, RimJ/RimL family n=1 Tax=Pseudoalteromonas denitrificans DSM 6059 TaxID=1123010 RepID=A0A1I1TI81_9GAMM|nr:GNAT family N-acetyltransferase [Pseudoalteromonas denitrificans]SFD58277.1 Protein N-acetyltransferase, RimJ/RimL family [Pseudoalteromonas denitrificans DSM 6059]